MLYDTLKSLLGSASVVNIDEAARMSRRNDVLESLEIEIETLEAELAEWESVCGVWSEEDAA
jgi:hypothetical protein